MWFQRGSLHVISACGVVMWFQHPALHVSSALRQPAIDMSSYSRRRTYIYIYIYIYSYSRRRHFTNTTSLMFVNLPGSKTVSAITRLSFHSLGYTQETFYIMRRRASIGVLGSTGCLARCRNQAIWNWHVDGFVELIKTWTQNESSQNQVWVVRKYSHTL